MSIYLIVELRECDDSENVVKNVLKNEDFGRTTVARHPALSLSRLVVPVHGTEARI